MKKFLLLIVAFLALVSCASKQAVVYVPVVHDSIQTRVEVRVDSVWRDRIRIEKVKGDTIRILDSVTVESFKWRDRTDSLYIRDTIPVVREVPGPTQYIRSGYDKFVSWGFWILVIVILGRTAWWIFKKVYLHV